MVKSNTKIPSRNDVPLSNYDLADIFQQMNERPNIILEKDISSDMDIEDIMKNSGHAVIFLEHEGQETGHWVVLLRHHGKKKLKDGKSGFLKNGLIYYYDPLGDAPRKKELVDVVLKKYPQLLFNDQAFQPEDSNACGRHCALSACFNKLGMSPFQIEEVMKSIGDVDAFVLDLVKKE